MLKNYFARKILKMFLISVFCLALIFLGARNFFNPVRKIFSSLAYPFQKTFYLAGRKISDGFSFFSSISGLHAENNRLVRENYGLKGQVALLENEKKENEKLRSELGLIPRAEFNLEASFVIGQDPQKQGDWLLIDKGSAGGIRENMPVIVSNGIIVGRISEVSLNSARVELLSYAKSSLNANDLETGAKGIIRGEFGLGIIMDMISQKDTINTGDTVVTSGLGSNMPKGLLVGRVQDVQPTADKLFQQAVIAPEVQYSKLDVIFIIKN